MPRIVQLDAFGGPEVLKIVDVEPSAPGAGEVRVRVGAIGLNRVESHFRKGSYLPASFPSRIGLEASGVVEAIGEGVSEFRPGERVAALTGVSMERYGTYGETMLYPADMLVKVPDGQSLTEAAACWMQYVTAYALVGVAAIAPGDAVAISAASSSVGLAAIQIANAHCAVPIAITRTRDKAQALLDAGAAHVIVSDEEETGSRVKALTGGSGPRIVFDAVGGPLLLTLMGCTRPQGMIISYGVLAGLPAEFPLISLLARNLTLRGWSADMLTQVQPLRAEVVAYVQKGLAEGALRPVIDRTFDLADIVDAHRHLEGNSQFGKIVVTTATADE